jgi:NAD(P)-dependent dehydrogenase (short-subunit alcohol dehydrogenase family)
MFGGVNPLALITGASRGIGRGIALELASLGYDLALNYRADEAAAKATAAECRESAAAKDKKIRVEIMQADISITAHRQRLVAEVQTIFGKLNLLINNAGAAPTTRADLLETSEASFDRLMAINVKGPFFLTQAVATWMIEQSRQSARETPYTGKIITVSSISAYTASINRGEYCVSKAALSMLTPLFAVRLAEHGISVYEIRPGIIQTDMTNPVKAKYDQLIEAGLTPIKRWGLPDDVGKAVAAIAQGLLPFSTGEVINVDGGFHLRRLYSQSVMALRIDSRLSPKALLPQIERLFELSACKILALEKTWKPGRGAPVFTAAGRYTSRGWTDWTEGFQYGSSLLQFEVTGEKRFLELGRRKTLSHMAPHVSHTGVHDHGFNNVSTYGNLWRMMCAGKIPHDEHEKALYELALKISAAVQASRWTPIEDGTGFIYSFNGPHSLFVDTIRSLRSLALGHLLGHVLMAERDQKISLLERLLQHARATAIYSIYYGNGRDAYDVSGRTAHESLFNIKNGSYRCPSTQQGYSPFSTWTRGLAWAVLGFAEQLEFLQTLKRSELQTASRSVKSDETQVLQLLTRAAVVTAEFYLDNCTTDGIPIWDTGAPNLHQMTRFMSKPADPFNPWEPYDSSAAAIAAQGFWRLARHFEEIKNERSRGRRYRQAALTIARTLMAEPYLSTGPRHQGLLLHSIYHRPNGWDYIPPGRKVPHGESSMWGDYHLRELGLLLYLTAKGQPEPAFFGHVTASAAKPAQPAAPTL